MCAKSQTNIEWKQPEQVDFFSRSVGRPRKTSGFAAFFTLEECLSIANKQSKTNIPYVVNIADKTIYCWATSNSNAINLAVRFIGKSVTARPVAVAEILAAAKTTEPSHD